MSERARARVCVGYSLNRSFSSLSAVQQHAAYYYIYSLLNVYISVYTKTHIPAAYITIYIYVYNTATCAHIQSIVQTVN